MTLLPLIAMFVIVHLVGIETLHVVLILLIGGVILCWVQIRFVPLAKEKFDDLP